MKIDGQIQHAEKAIYGDFRDAAEVKMITTYHKARAKEKDHTRDLINMTEMNAEITLPITTEHMAKVKKKVLTRDLIEALEMIVGASTMSNGEILRITIVNRLTDDNRG